MYDEQVIEELAQFFKAVADVSRLKLLLHLMKQEANVNELAEATGLTLSGVSHQLKLLKLMKLVKSSKQGKYVYYSLDDHHVKHIINDSLIHLSEESSE